MATYNEIKEIVLGKLVYKTIDKDYEELSEALFGEGNCFNSSEVRKRMYGMKTVIDAVENEAEKSLGENAIESLERKKLDLQIERQKLFDERTALNKIVRTNARQEELDEAFIKSINDGALPRLEYTYHDHDDGNNDLIVSLNDIHYGATIDNYWRKYNSDICGKMISKYIDKSPKKKTNQKNLQIFKILIPIAILTIIQILALQIFSSL